MQRIGLLPKEVQAKILLMAIETPSAALVKAAIGDRDCNPGWWATKVGRDRGYQRFLNYHTPCLRLWARALEVLPDGSLAWKWSRTNVFMNKSGGAYVRGTWDDLANEMAIRRNICRKPPVDKFLHEGLLQNRYNQQVRALYVNVPNPGYGASDDRPWHFRCTFNRVVLADLKSGNFWLDWSGAENARCEFVYGLVKMIMADPV
jgi:hypothetical protein